MNLKLEIVKLENDNVISTSCICHDNLGVNAPHLPHTTNKEEFTERFETQMTVCQEYYDLFKTEIENNYNRRPEIPGAICEEHGQIYHLYNES